MLIILTGCSSKAPIYVQQPFLGFAIYDKPEPIKLEVERNCVATYMLKDYKTKIKVGDCIRDTDAKKLVTKIKVLEQIVENYELDISAYNRLHKDRR